MTAAWRASIVAAVVVLAGCTSAAGTVAASTAPPHHAVSVAVCSDGMTAAQAATCRVALDPAQANRLVRWLARCDRLTGSAALECYGFWRDAMNGVAVAR